MLKFENIETNLYNCVCESEHLKRGREERKLSSIMIHATRRTSAPHSENDTKYYPETLQLTNVKAHRAGSTLFDPAFGGVRWVVKILLIKSFNDA